MPNKYLLHERVVLVPDQMGQRTTWELLISELALRILACGSSASNRDSHEKQIKSEFEGEAKIHCFLLCLLFDFH